MQNKSFSTDSINSIEKTKGKSEPQKDEIQIIRAKVDSVFIYEVKEEELQTIQSGGQSLLYLNIFISAASFFVSFLISLLTASFEGKLITEIIFIVITVAMAIIAVVFIFLWVSARKDLKLILKRIKQRLP